MLKTIKAGTFSPFGYFFNICLQKVEKLILFSKQLDEQELELEDLLEKLSNEFRALFEAQAEKSEIVVKPKKVEAPKKSSLKKSKSEEASNQTASEKKLDIAKSVR